MIPRLRKRRTLSEYIDARYSGSKETLRPIFDDVRAVLEGLEDVTLEGRTTYSGTCRR
jgi:hypothetical protein